VADRRLQYWSGIGHPKGHRTVEVPMRRREAKRPALAVRASYEADRLGGQLLADAFERLAPTIVRRLAPVCAPDRATPDMSIADTAVIGGRP
jgi:hypothetical protein